jgi:hypothetical protein
MIDQLFGKNSQKWLAGKLISLSFQCQKNAVILLAPTSHQWSLVLG